MKNYLHFITGAILLLLTGTPVIAQEPGISDTIYANEQNQVALFFPSPIRQAITGNSQTIFTYNKNQLQHFGLLQAMEGAETNLLVIDQQGLVYSYLLKYRKKLSRFLYFLSSEDAVGTEMPFTPRADSIAVAKKPGAWKVLSERFAKTAGTTLRKTKNADIVFRLQSIVYHQEVFFFIMEIENNSEIPYQPDRLLVSRNSRKQGKRKAMQSVPLKILETYSFPDRIVPRQKKQFTVILPKFTIPSDYSLQFELYEKNGARNMELELYQRHFKKVQYQ